MERLKAMRTRLQNLGPLGWLTVLALFAVFGTCLYFYASAATAALAYYSGLTRTQVGLAYLAAILVVNFAERAVVNFNGLPSKTSVGGKPPRTTRLWWAEWIRKGVMYGVLGLALYYVAFVGNWPTWGVVGFTLIVAMMVFGTVVDRAK